MASIRMAPVYKYLLKSITKKEVREERMLEDIPHMRANMEVEKAAWAGDIKTADTNEEHLIHMGEILTDGIVKQFPNKFK
ncbi:hypothetical protein AA0X95_14250 [Bacillus sp. 1P10SD]|uniref:hypothetical protein n=1 Tax=Bacillus sp. 1P10SD TaxID=3132265 RepID=UPI0039A77027